MKIIGTIILLLIATALAGFVLHDETIGTDITEKHFAFPDAGEILNLVDLTGENKWNGAQLKFSLLSDVSLNKTSRVKIPAENKWLSNELVRKKKTEEFQKEVSVLFAERVGDGIGKNYSSVYTPIARELKILSESNAEKKILVIYSDLMENSTSLSFYDENVFRELKKNPESIKEQFEDMGTLPNLLGIEIFIVFEPKDTKEDEKFRVVAGFYKNLLEAKGARVGVRANLSN